MLENFRKYQNVKKRIFKSSNKYVNTNDLVWNILIFAYEYTLRMIYSECCTIIPLPKRYESLSESEMENQSTNI